MENMKQLRSRLDAIKNILGVSAYDRDYEYYEISSDKMEELIKLTQWRKDKIRGKNVRD